VERELEAGDRRAAGRPASRKPHRRDA
jgi:hypothetical protein